MRTRERNSKISGPSLLRGVGIIFSSLMGLAILALAIWAILLVVDPARAAKFSWLWTRATNAFSHWILNEPPRVYYLVLEKNGADIRLTPGESLSLSYQDVLAVKDISADTLGVRQLIVDVEGLGGENDWRRQLQAADLVESAIYRKLSPRKDRGSEKRAIVVLFKRENLARFPIEVTITPQDWLRHARKTKKVDEQILFLRNALELMGEDTGVRKTLAALYAGQGRREEALVQYREVVRRSPGDIAAWKEMIKLHRQAGDLEKLAATAREAMKVAPQDMEIKRELARAYVQGGDLDRAIALYRQMLKESKADHAVHYHLGELYERQGNHAQAIEHYRAALEIKPGEPSILTALAEVSFKAGNFDDTLLYLKDLLKLEPRRVALHVLQAMAYGAKGMLAEEIESYRSALRLDRQDANLRLNLGAAYERNKQFREAADVYLGLLKVRPSDPDILERLANSLFRISDYQGAIRHYEQLLKIGRRLERAGSVHMNMAYAYGELKQYAKSAASYEAALKHGMKDPLIHYNLGVTYGLLKNERRSIEAYERFVSLRPTVEVLNILAAYYMDNRQFERAEKAFLRLLEMGGGRAARASIYASLGQAAGNMGKTSQEIEYLRSSLKYDPDDDEVYFSLGEALEKAKRYEEARQAYLRVLELNRGSTRAREKVRQMGVRLLQEKFN